MSDIVFPASMVLVVNSYRVARNTFELRTPFFGTETVPRKIVSRSIRIFEAMYLISNIDIDDIIDFYQEDARQRQNPFVLSLHDGVASEDVTVRFANAPTLRVTTEDHFRVNCSFIEA